MNAYVKYVCEIEVCQTDEKIDLLTQAIALITMCVLR